MKKRFFPLSVVASFLTGIHMVEDQDGGFAAMVGFVHFFESFDPGIGMYSAMYGAASCKKLRAEFHRRYPAFEQVNPDAISEMNWRHQLELWKESLGAEVEITALTEAEAKACFEG